MHMTIFVPYTAPAVPTRVYTTAQLVDQLYANLCYLAPVGSESAYSAGYLRNAMADIAEGGINELVSHVDWTNQLIEARRVAT
jgi:hypothetical protein